MTKSSSIPLVTFEGHRPTLPRRAFELGAFRLPLSDAIVDAAVHAYAAAAEFFAQPADVKRQFDARTNGTLRGWTLAAQEQAGRPRDYEAFDVALPRERCSMPAGPLRLFDPENDWPTETLHEATDRLIPLLCDGLQRSVEDLLDRASGLGEGHFGASDTRFRLSYLRYLRYNARPSPSRSSGFYEHTDFESFSILLESKPGIEIWSSTEEDWLTVALPESEALVLVGELGEVISRRQLRAARHRVDLSRSTDERQAIVLFSAPSYDTQLPVEVGEAEAPRTAGDYLFHRFARSFGLITRSVHK